MSEAALQLSDRHFRAISELIERQVGIKLPAAKRVMLEGRLHKRVRALKRTGLNDYLNYLFTQGHLAAEMTHLIDAVTTNKTDFFREPQHFAFLKNVAVPELLKLRGREPQGLKVWSAACSTGMEAYTTAMVLDDLVQAGMRFSFRILGTDISTSVLREAKLAIYPREAITPVPNHFIKRYFLTSRDEARAEVRVVPELRRLVHFMRMNLMDVTYPVDRDVDVIFCRNVLIYFDKDRQRKVVEQLASHLRPGGYLLVGHSESMVHNVVPSLRQVQPTVFRV
jgi:chemotaxis protein methyltransferase CheR